MRNALAAAITALAVALTALPALAADTSKGSIQGAEAVWYMLQGGVATGVLIRPVQDREQASGTSSQRTVGVNVQVNQEYVDPATGETVYVQLSSVPYYAPATVLKIDRLRGASVTANVTLEGQTWTGSGDAQPAGPYHVTVAAQWTPAAGTTRTISNVYDTEFGVKIHNRQATESRPAVATGSITGDLNLGSLGQTDGTLVVARFFSLLLAGPSMAVLGTMLDVAAATGRSTSQVMEAFADWQTAGGTQILLTADQDRPAGTGRPMSAYVEIIQDYCDTSTNELVSRDLFSGQVPAVAGAIDPSIRHASVTAAFGVSGNEFRTPNCEEPRWDEQTYSFVGPFNVAVSAQWTATGGIDHYRVLYIERTPSSSTLSRYDSRGRQATAAGSVSGELVNAPLTDVINAFLSDDIRLSYGG